MTTASPPLTRDDVHVWYRATGHLGDDAVRDCEATLAADERVRASRFHFPRDRRDYAAAHALLRRTLSRYAAVPPAGWRFQPNAHGKPALSGADAGDLAFNLSHTRGCVACIVARATDVGIDVEPVDETRAHRELAARFFSDTERRYLDACPAQDVPRRFVELWTLKEAYIKALGLGLSCLLESFSFTFPDEARIRFDPEPNGSPTAWQFALAMPSVDVCLAVAVRCTGDLRRYRLLLRDADRDGAAPFGWMRQSTR